MRAGRALGQLPFEVEQVFEEVVGPLGRRLAPNDFEAGGDGVCARSGLEPTAPAQALIFDHSAFRVRAQQRGVASTVGLTEGVTASDQRDGFVIVHRHTGEGFTNVDR